MINECEIKVRGLTFRALEAGTSGEAVVLLHGFPELSLMWVDLMNTLAEAGYHCLAPDQRGYSSGARPTDVDAYRYEELVADALAFGHELGDRFHLIGHDWGAIVAWLTAGTDASSVASMTALSIAHYAAWARSVYDDPAMEFYRDQLLKTWMTEGLGEASLPADGLRMMWAKKRPELIEQMVERLTEPGAMTAALNWYRASRGHKRALEDYVVSRPGPARSPRDRDPGDR
jgi:pimeloyl-ACP methyl ester carboxylesterase